MGKTEEIADRRECLRRDIKSGNNPSVMTDKQSCARGRARLGVRLAACRRRTRRATRPGGQSDGKRRRRARTEAVYASGAWLTNLVVRSVYEPAGNVTALASASGSLTGRCLYDPLGNTLGVALRSREGSRREIHGPAGLVAEMDVAVQRFRLSRCNS